MKAWRVVPAPGAGLPFLLPSPLSHVPTAISSATLSPGAKINLFSFTLVVPGLL